MTTLDAVDLNASRFAQLGALLLDAGLSVTDVRIALERVRDRALPSAAMSFAVLPSAIFVSRDDRGGASVIGNASPGTLSMRQSAHTNRLVIRLAAGTLHLDDIGPRITAIRELRPAHPTLG